MINYKKKKYILWTVSKDKIGRQCSQEKSVYVAKNLWGNRQIMKELWYALIFFNWTCEVIQDHNGSFSNEVKILARVTWPTWFIDAGAVFYGKCIIL